MIQLKEEKFYTLLQFFFDLVKEQGVDFSYGSIEEYIIKTYGDGKEIYENLLERYNRELKEYHGKEKSFEEMFGGAELL